MQKTGIGWCDACDGHLILAVCSHVPTRRDLEVRWMKLVPRSRRNPCCSGLSKNNNHESNSNISSKSSSNSNSNSN